MDFRLELNNNRDLQLLFGRYDQNLKIIEKELGVLIIRSEDGLKIIGHDSKVQIARGLFSYLMTFVEKGKDVKKADIVYALRLVDKEKEIDFKRLAKEKIEVSVQGGLITPKTKGQIEYIEAIKTNDLVFCIGPAGTGKTYTGTMAVQQVAPNFALNFSTAVSAALRLGKMANVVEPLPDMSVTAAPWARRNS